MKIIIDSAQKKLLKESLGVSTSTVPYVNLVYETLEPIVIDYFNGKNDGGDKKIKITLKEITKVYRQNLDEFLDFPIEEIVINFKLEKLSQPSNFVSTGAAYHIGKKNQGGSYLKTPSYSFPKKILEELVDKTIVGIFDFGIQISEDQDKKTLDNALYDLLDTIMHEFNHLYEFYKRLEKDEELDFTLSYAGSKNFNVPREIFEVWNQFLYYVYYSEPYEINAMVQESYSKRLRMDFETFKKTYYWKTAEEMEEFDANKFYNNLIKKIDDYDPEYKPSILDRLFKWFISDYQTSMKKEGFTPKKQIVNSKDLLDLLLKFQTRIQNSGKKLQRKFVRVYALSPD